jgi:hypothetical protein
LARELEQLLHHLPLLDPYRGSFTFPVAARAEFRHVTGKCRRRRVQPIERSMSAMTVHASWCIRITFRGKSAVNPRAVLQDSLGVADAAIHP